MGVSGYNRESFHLCLGSACRSAASCGVVLEVLEWFIEIRSQPDLAAQTSEALEWVGQPRLGVLSDGFHGLHFRLDPDCLMPPCRRQRQVKRAVRIRFKNGGEGVHDVEITGSSFIVKFSLCAVLDRLEHGQDVFDRGIALDVVDRIADEAAVLVEDIDAFAHLAIDLLG